MDKAPNNGLQTEPVDMSQSRTSNSDRRSEDSWESSAGDEYGQHGDLDGQASRPGYEDDAHHFSNQISWVIWKIMAEIREPVIYLSFLLFSIVYFQLSVTVIGIDEQFKFRNEINQLLERTSFDDPTGFGPTLDGEATHCPEFSFSDYNRDINPTTNGGRAFSAMKWMLQFARIFDPHVGCQGCAFDDRSLHEKAILAGFWIQSSTVPSTAISSERFHMDISFQHSYSFTIENEVLRNRGSDLTEGMVVFSNTFRELAQDQCVESRMVRNYFGVPDDENNTYIDNLKCFSQSGVYTMNRQAMCGVDFVNLFVALLKGYTGLPCDSGPDDTTCVHADVYIPLFVQGKNRCDVDYLAMVKYQTSNNEFDLKFVPVDLYPNACRTYYIFSQIFVVCLAVLTTLTFKIAQFIGDFNVKKAKGRSSLSTIAHIINENSSKGWVWFDFIVIIVGILLAIWYFLFYYAHRELKRDFDRERGSGLNSFLSSDALYTQCVASEEQAPEWGDDTFRHSPLCFPTPLLFGEWELQHPSLRDWLGLAQDLSPLMAGFACSGEDYTISDEDTCTDIVATKCYREAIIVLSILLRSDIDDSALDDDLGNNTDKLFECLFQYFDEVHSWRFDPKLDDSFLEMVGFEKKSDETTAEAWARLHDQRSASKTRNFERTFFFQEGVQSITAFLVLLLHLRLLKYSFLDSRMMLIMNSLKRSSTNIFYFMLVFMIGFLGFVVSIQFYFGFYGVAGYSTFWDSFVATTNVLFDPFPLEIISDLSQGEKTLFYIWYYLFIIIMILTAMNLIVAILVISLEEEIELMKDKPPRTLRGSFMRAWRMFWEIRQANRKWKREISQPDPRGKSAKNPVLWRTLTMAKIIYNVSEDQLITSVVRIQSRFRGLAGFLHLSWFTR